MKVTRANALWSIVFATISIPAMTDCAFAAPQANSRISSNNSITAEQIANAQSKFAAVLAIANKFSPSSTDGTIDPQRVQLINNLMLGDARGLEEAGAATNLKDALAASALSVSRRSNSPAASATAPTANALGSATSDLVYTPITPCRIVDTRNIGAPPGTPLASGSSQTFSGAGGTTQGGSGCTAFTGTVPAALAMNVTVDSRGMPTYADSFIAIKPEGSSALTSWINYRSGEEIANQGVATLNQTTGNFTVVTQSITQVAIDVFGYFRAPSPVPTSSMSFTSSVGAGTVTTIAGGLVGTVAVLPVSGAELTTPPSISLLGGALDVSTNTALLTQAQTFPQSGTFGTMKATFMETAALSLIGSTVTLTASLYSGPLTNLTPTGLSCSVTLTGVIALGSIQTCATSSGTASVNAGDSGFIVISASATGISLLNSVTLGASVGIAP